MTDVYEYSEFKRENFIYDFATLLPEERIQKKKNFEELQTKKEVEKAAAAKKTAEAKAAADAIKPVEHNQDDDEENKQ
jgi:hypothetical protein